MKILTSLQELALDCIFSVDIIRQHFYLTGGTALSAYYLHHRVSDDLDIFTHGVDIDSVEKVVEDSLKTAGLSFTKERSAPDFRRYVLEGELRLDLVKDVEFRVGAPELRDNIMVDNLKNIAVNKVLAIYGRLDPKDYVDMFFILKGDIPQIIELFDFAGKKDAGFEPFQWSRIIADAETISVLPRMIVKLDIKDLKKFYQDLRAYVVDSCDPRRRS